MIQHSVGVLLALPSWISELEVPPLAASMLARQASAGWLALIRRYSRADAAGEGRERRRWELVINESGSNTKAGLKGGEGAPERIRPEKALQKAWQDISSSTSFNDNRFESGIRRALGSNGPFSSPSSSFQWIIAREFRAKYYSRTEKLPKPYASS